MRIDSWMTIFLYEQGGPCTSIICDVFKCRLGMILALHSHPHALLQCNPTGLPPVSSLIVSTPLACSPRWSIAPLAASHGPGFGAGVRWAGDHHDGDL